MDERGQHRTSLVVSVLATVTAAAALAGAVLLVATADEPASAGSGSAATDGSQPQAAILALGAAATTATPSDGSGHSHGPGRVDEVPLSPSEQEVFDTQWAAAQQAVATLDTHAEAEAAGYVRAAVQGAGIGVHWVDYTLVDAPFDVAHPAMLLFDERSGKSDLVGFSYWLRSATAPEGFAGANDHWHQHTGLCVEADGWVDREMATAGGCEGTYLAGGDLWMLHAWVVPRWSNRWGDFAVMNPKLCPPIVGTPAPARCPAADGSQG